MSENLTWVPISDEHQVSLYLRGSVFWSLYQCFSRLTLSVALDNGPAARYVIPLPRNEDIVNRAEIVAQLQTLLPATSGCQSAALYGLGGSG